MHIATISKYYFFLSNENHTKDNEILVLHQNIIFITLENELLGSNCFNKLGVSFNFLMKIFPSFTDFTLYLSSAYSIVAS